MSSSTNGKALYEDLDTTFVNLWSLLRNLTQRGFVGRVRVELADYSADVFLNGSSTPLVREIDHKAGTEIVEETALHRVVLRARETPGKISVFEGLNEAAAGENIAIPPPASGVSAETESPVLVEHFELPPDPINNIPSSEPYGIDESFAEFHPRKAVEEVPADSQLPLTVSIGGELIGAVERGINASGENFNSLFNQVRLELADDFSFLDPMSQALDYGGGVASLNNEISAGVFVSGVSEALRRTVDKVAVGDRARRVRERIALELLGVARKRREAFEHSAFRAQMDRIAGTKVI